MVYTQEPDKLITCPLDDAHRILRSRMQFHLVRCLKNNTLGTRLKCPWNPLHIIDKFAYKDHYTRQCENMPNALAFMCQTEAPRDVASVPVGATNDVMPPTEEDWDAEPGPVGTYNPQAYVEERQLLRASVGLSKAKRKAFRDSERQRFAKLEETLPIQANSRPPKPKKTEPLREPRKISSVNTSMMDDLNSSRLSEDEKKMRANKAPEKEMRKPHSVRSAYGSDISGKENGAYRKKIPPSNGRSDVSSDDESRLVDKVPNLCKMADSSFLERSNVTPGFENSMIYHSAVENSILLDEAACPPNLVAPNDELSKRLAELDITQKKLDQQREILYREMLQRDQVPKLISSAGSIVSLNLHDDSKSNGHMQNDDSSVSLSQQSYYTIPKCAANFPKLTRNGNAARTGRGRGMVIDADSFENNQPGFLARTSTNPFRTSQITTGANTSHLTYTISNADDEDSLCGYSRVE